MDLFQFYKPYKKSLAFVIAGALLTAGMEVTFPMIVRHILGVVLPTRDMQSLLYEGAGLLGLYLLCLGITYCVYCVGRTMGVRVERDLRNSLFRHLENLDFAFFDKEKTGHLVSRVTGDIGEVGNIIFEMPHLAVVCLITMGGSAFFLFYINPLLAVFVLMLVALKTGDTIFLNRKMKSAFAETRQHMGVVGSVATEILAAVRAVKAFNGENRAYQRFSDVTADLAKSQMRTFRYQAYMAGTVTFFSNAINLTIIVVGAVLMMNDLMTMSDLVAFLMYLMLFLRPIMQLTSLTEQYQRSMAGFRRYQELIRVEPKVRGGSVVADSRRIKGDVVFEHVDFAYPDGTHVLKDFNLNVKAGEQVALVGPTGAGKSSVASLLLRFYDVTGGKITLDGRDIREYTLESLHECIGIVQQDMYLFSDSVSENIRLGRTDSTQADIEAAAKDARAHEFISRLPRGYDSYIGERGVMLSGGQKQRLSLSRVFLKNPPVLILDEATAAMDNETEKQVLQSLAELSRKRTTLTIAHRLATVRHADRIIVLSGGRICESGSHEELMKVRGEYYDLYMSQFNKT